MENKLNIQITVTDEQITSLLKGNLENLPDEKIEEILSNVLAEFFKTDKGQRLFYSQDYYDPRLTPTPLLSRMIERAVSTDLLKSCVEEFIENIKDKYDSIIKECIIQTFSNMFFTEMREYSMEGRFRSIISDCLNK